MKTISYDTIPSLSRWKSDSSVTLAKRDAEPGLARIDQLLDEYMLSPKQQSERGPLLIDMFLTIEYWFEMRRLRPMHVKEGRLPAMRALFETVVNVLKPYFRDRDGELPTAAGVANGIKLMTGLGMSEHGFQADTQMGFASFSEQQVWDRRVWFKGGLAYQIPWWSGSPSKKLEPANSKHGYMPMIRGGRNRGNAEAMVGWSPFIMTISRMIYMSKHDFDATRKSNNYFHSSYNNGHTVAMAGTIAINEGVITGIRLDSGHYQPGAHNLVAFLMALKMYQVDLKRISLLDFKGDWIGDVMANADTFLKSGKSWENFHKSAMDEVKKGKDTAFQRVQRFG